MHFLLLNQFYPPDPAPTGHYLHGLARVLVQRGHQVRVYCSRRSYDGSSKYAKRESLDGVDVHRLAATGFGRRGHLGKLTDYGSFYASLACALVFNRLRPDLILSLTTPPYIGLLGKFAARKQRCLHAHWIMDLYPDVLYAHGMARQGGGLFRVLQRLTRHQLAGAQSVLALGPHMAQKLSTYIAPSPHQMGEGQGEGHCSSAFSFSPFPSALTSDFCPLTSAPCPPTSDVCPPTSAPCPLTSAPCPLTSGVCPPTSVPLPAGLTSDVCRLTSEALTSVPHIPLWSTSDLSPWPEDKANPLRAARGWSTKETVFLYSGNMGLGHRFHEFLQAAKHLGPTGPVWAFAGGGKRRSEVEAFAASHPEARIEVLGYTPQGQLRSHLCSADVHLASLDSAWQGLIVPSKLQASFAVGRPVLYVGGRQCETATWIQESGGGWVVDENDIPGLLSAIAQATDPDERHKRARAAYAFARTHFDMSRNCTRLAETLETAAGSPGFRS